MTEQNPPGRGRETVWRAALRRRRDKKGFDGAKPSKYFHNHMADSAKLSRRTPAHHAIHHDGNLSPIVYVTVCASGRKRILARSETMELILAKWKEASSWLVGRFVIMPDHMHLFCSPCGLEHPPLKNWVRFWKSRVSSEWPYPDEQPIWQVDCWDKQLRRGESYQQKWEYVVANPVRHRLVSTPDDWLYKGELNVLRWHEK